jgi:hypothetical protein
MNAIAVLVMLFGNPTVSTVGNTTVVEGERIITVSGERNEIWILTDEDWQRVRAEE